MNLSIGISYAKRLEGIKSVDFYSGIANYLAPTLVVGIYTLTMLPYFFIYAIQLLFAVLLFFLMMQKPAVIRLIIYTLTIIPFSISFSNKRELILVLIVIMFCEAVRSRAKISLTFRTMLLGIVGFSTFLFFITVMSIMRGYGGFAGADTLWSAIPYILPYVSSDLFLSNFADNLEVSHTLPALVLPIEYAIESPLSFRGATIKTNFCHSPRRYFGSSQSQR